MCRCGREPLSEERSNYAEGHRSEARTVGDAAISAEAHGEQLNIMLKQGAPSCSSPNYR